MKKAILLLSTLALFLTSCNSDDDSGNQDIIIGTWTYHQLFVNGVGQNLTDCEMQETFIFAADGTVFYEYYEEDQGACVLEEDVSGTWTNDGDSIYTLTVDGESSSEELTFEGNTFYFEYTEAVDPLDPVLVTFREVYIKN